MRRENNKADEVLHEVVRQAEGHCGEGTYCCSYILTGGDKSTQKQDIEKAKELAATI